MDSSSAARPEPTHQQPERLSFDAADTEKLTTQPHPRPPSEFDPCANAKITSPFYLYNHDSPRPSAECSKSRMPILVDVKDLEANTADLSPTNTITREKHGSVDSGKVKRWPQFNPFAHRRSTSRCMTKKKVTWWKALEPKHRLIIKIVIAVLLVGMIVGIAVGVSANVGGGVYKNNNTTSNIGKV